MKELKRFGKRPIVSILGSATEGAAVLIADWNDALFIHFRIDPEILAPAIPFELDLFDGAAYVSLVAFTQSNLRLAIGGKLAQLLSRPLATHEFLNLRTYVRDNDEAGIYFIAEWIPNALAAMIGPRLYGLPYRLGTLKYQHKNARDVRGTISARSGALSYRAAIDPAKFQQASPGTLNHFLLERYLAFTRRGNVTRRFEVAHDPWLQTVATVRLQEISLIENFDWWGPEMVSAHFSPGVRAVRISAPMRGCPMRSGRCR